MTIPGLPPVPSNRKAIPSHSPALAFKNLAEHLPDKLPFPFSGIVAFEVGDGPPILASHFPQQENLSSDCPLNVLSVGKLFTAVAVMQLIEEGKFSLQTPLSKLLSPDELDLQLKPPYSEEKPVDLKMLQKESGKITVAHLLSHTAGFEKRPGTEQIPEGENWNEKTIGKYSYSNYGYQLLAQIIGKFSSEGSFEKHIENRIFMLSNMNGAIHEIHYPDKSAKLTKFGMDKNGALFKDTTPEPYPHGNGCWRMPIKDLISFGKALRNNTLIREQSFRTMLEGNPPLCFWVDRDEKGVIVGYGHPGSASGQSSFFHTWLTDPPITAAVLSNYPNGSEVKPLLDPIIPALISNKNQ